MTRLLFLAMLLLPATAQGLDWSADTGYLRYSFSGQEQLGATSPNNGLSLSSGQGPSLFASVGLHSQHLTLSLRGQAAYLFLSGQPEQEEYKVKGKRVDTSNLASPLLSADLMAGFRIGKVKVELAGGVATLGVGERWSAPFDFDTAIHGAASVTFAYKGMDVTLAGDLMLLPAVTAKGDLTPAIGWNLTFGKAAEVPVFAEAPVVLSADPTPPVVLPATVTPSVAVTPPESVTPVVQPAPVVIAPPKDPTPAAPPVLVRPPVSNPIREDDPIILVIVSTLSGNAALEVEVKAYAENKAVAQARADQAREVLVGHHGVEASRVWAVGKVRKGKSKAGKRDLEFTFAPKGRHK